MAYQVLARKWRPKIFDEVIGQDHIVRTLKNALKNQKLAHAYLLTGTRGVGKTTIARLFAKALLCENPGPNFDPCLKCSACTGVDDGSSMNYTEIDGASNNGVDNIRQLIDNVQYLPTQGNYKVYVIDEVHMLTVSAFNALLKTLEEPPKHVVFIFATTNPDKLLGTVISRCQRFDFKSMTLDSLIKHLALICKSEGISYSSDLILEKVARLGRGSVRDTLSLFDQVLSIATNNSITESDLTNALGIASTNVLAKVINALLSSNATQLRDTYWESLKHNTDLKTLCYQILDGLFEVVQNIDNLERSPLIREVPELAPVISKLKISELFWVYQTLANDLEWTLNSSQPENNCLVSLLKISMRNKILGLEDDSIEVGELKKKDNNQDSIESEKKPIEEETVDNTQVEQSTEAKLELPAIEESTVASIPIQQFAFEDFLDFMATKNPAIRANLEMGKLLEQPYIETNTLYFKYGIDHKSNASFNYLVEKDINTELKTILKSYIIDADNVELTFKLLNVEDEQKLDFTSVHQDKINIKEAQDKEKVQRFMDNKYIQDVQSLFQSRFDKVVAIEKEQK